MQRRVHTQYPKNLRENMMRIFLTSREATELMRCLITLLVLLGSHGMAYSAGDDVSSMHLEERVRAMKDEAEDLKEQLEQWQEAAAVSKVNRGHRAKLEKKSLLLKQEQAKVDGLKSDIAEIQARKKELREKYQAHIKAIRAEVASEEIPELRCKNGKIYFEVEIVGFDPQGVAFRHRDGAANLHYSQLPNPLQQRLNFDPEEARKFVEQEANKREKRKKELAKMVGKKLKVPKDEAVVAVEQVRRQVQPWKKPVKRPREEGEPAGCRVDVNWRKTLNGRKLIIIDAKAGSEGIRIKVSNDQQFEVRAGEEAVFECWVGKKYSVKVFQGGRLIERATCDEKAGLELMLTG